MTGRAMIQRLMMSCGLAVAGLGLAGCGDGGGEVSGEINGRPFVATEAAAMHWPAARSYDSGNRPERTDVLLDAAGPKFQIFAEGVDSGDNNGNIVMHEFAVTAPGVTGPGSYDLVRGDLDLQRFQVSLTDRTQAVPHFYSAPATDESVGTLTITSLTDTGVAGTLTLSVPPAAVDAGYGPATAELSFELPLTVVNVPLDSEALEASSSQPLGGDAEEAAE